MCFPALAASISRKSTRPGVNAGTVTFTDATDTGTDTGTYRHTVVLAIVELGAWRAQVQADTRMWVFKQPLGVQACLRCMFGCVSVVLACACAYATARTGAVHHAEKKKTGDFLVGLV
jgi:hypothetical protein